MHLGTPALLAFLERHRHENAMVLATVTGTEGSTYRKPGAMMLMAPDGDFEGLISGGCLEGDLVEHAKRVFDTGQPAQVTYDLSADDDLVWSLGIGCDGVIHLQLQCLDAESLTLLRHIGDSHRQRSSVLMALPLGEAAQNGALASIDRAGVRLGDGSLLALLDHAADEWPQWRCRRVGQGAGEALLVQLPAPVRVLICGAGPDAVPLAGALRALDWEVVVVDHRPAFARPERFPAGCRIVPLRPRALSEQIDLEGIDGAVLMTHHLENDAEYLRQLCQQPPRYLGVLGPAARKERLRAMADCPDQSLCGPVGLDIGAELPASIALSIAAEIHAVLNARDGRPLTELAHDD